MHVTSYLYFNGRTEEALAYYEQALGARINHLMKFNQHPEGSMNPPGSDDKVMHACFNIGDTALFASDGMCGGGAKFEGISLTMHAKDAAEAEKLFAAITKDGQVQMPMTETFFAHRFGMAADKFGVGWLVIADKSPS